MPNVGAAQRSLNDPQKKAVPADGYTLDPCCAPVLATRSLSGVVLQQAAGVELKAGKALINAGLQKQNERLFATQSVAGNKGFLDVIKAHKDKPHSAQTHASAFWSALYASKSKGDGFF